MKTLYLDCGMGAAGDMLTAALLELLPDPDGFVDELNALGIPGVQYRREASVKCGITGTHILIALIFNQNRIIDQILVLQKELCIGTISADTTIFRIVVIKRLVYFCI